MEIDHEVLKYGMAANQYGAGRQAAAQIFV
jgi:hypothetical protein